MSVAMGAREDFTCDQTYATSLLRSRVSPTTSYKEKGFSPGTHFMKVERRTFTPHI
jgi:hypothetical protein